MAGSFASSNRLSKNPSQTVGGIKALHDSCYVPPVENFRVLQDNDPIKKAAVEEAKKRFESAVAFKKTQNQHYIREHALNVQHEQRVIAHENMDRKQKV